MEIQPPRQQFQVPSSPVVAPASQVPMPELEALAHKRAKKTGRFWNCCGIIAGLFLILAGVGVGGYFYAQQLMRQPVTRDAAKAASSDFIISQGDRVADISKRLQDKKLISNAYVFQWLTLKEGISGYFQPGTYHLNASMTMQDIAHVLAHQKQALIEQSLTFVEGWTAKQMTEQVRAQSTIDADDFAKRVASPHAYFDDYDFVHELPAKATLEGYLFPDTYRVDEKTTADILIRKMLSNFGKKFTHDMRAKLLLDGRKSTDVITLASILEKEVQTPQDKKIVAGVFTNRLRVGKRLESDVTIQYGISLNPTLNASAFTKTNTPYNTYQINGLPPGPIANPGMDAIQAAINPAQTDYFFFLTVPQTGEVIYAKTFDEHQKNVAKYLR